MKCCSFQHAPGCCTAAAAAAVRVTILLLSVCICVCTGWGNCGFGATLLLMPLLYKGFSRLWNPLIAWRAAFFVPGGLQLAAGLAVLLLADDNPQGRLPALNKWVTLSHT